MLEITGDDISNLSDIDLRSLIGLLCEAELRAHNIPTAGVTWGGHHNASDGGVDVRVDISSDVPQGSFIPNGKTIFQVKKPDMPRAEILHEMAPDGNLKDVVKELIRVNGAYVIISSQGSTADSALRRRREAMVEAIINEPNYQALTVDFYDRERVAAWVRSHPSIILWVREKIGNPLQGWLPHDNWSNCPQGITEEYLIDTDVRLYQGYGLNKQGLSIVKGLNEIRNTLQMTKSSVRIVGLSGVGKTRFIQALFDERLGENVLNKASVLYTDMNSAPNPDPIGMAERLVAYQTKFILVIDNCPPSLHRRLCEVCKKGSSKVSLITVEYDVKDDEPEETEVFTLEPSSQNLIEKVILKRFNQLNEITARRIAEFSGGNARVAIALSRTVEKGEDLSGLKDNELFNRLFHQRNEHDSSLMQTAEICSLVYSFNSEMGSQSELKFLSNLASLNVSNIYRDVSELLRRDLVQKRHIWRAVLPHAIANRLAFRALENLPVELISYEFENNAPKRLLKSFSRRLSYLHESQEAIEIARRWFENDGYLGDFKKFDDFKIDIFTNIAPLNLELTLSTLEKEAKSDEGFCSRKNPYFIHYVRVLRALAYDGHLFVRATKLICKFALTEKPNENYHSIKNELESLFYIYLSGTHASAEERLEIIKGLVESDKSEEVNLGFILLNATLKCGSFTGSHQVDFGARVRDYGYEPKNKDEYKIWFKIFIEYALNVALSKPSFNSQVKKIMGSNFRSLWNYASVDEELEIFVKSIIEQDTWRDGWKAILDTIKFDGEKMAPDKLERLKFLLSLTQPKTLVEQSEFYTLSGDSYFDLLDTLDLDKEHIIAKKVEELGRQVAVNEDTLNILLPKLLINTGTAPGVFDFGRGLAQGGGNSERIWYLICGSLTSLGDQDYNYQLLRGYLNGLLEIDSQLTNQFLNQALDSELLSAVYPILQTSVKLTDIDSDRLIKSLHIGKANIWLYRSLAYGRTHEGICDEKLAEILKLLYPKDGGIDVALEILSMRLYGAENKEDLSEYILNIGKEIISYVKFDSDSNNRDEHNMGEVIKNCYKGEQALNAARELCEKLYSNYISYIIGPHDYREVLSSIVEVQPKVFLDIFLSNHDKEVVGRVSQIFSEKHDILSCIAEPVIKEWLESDFEKRTPLLARIIRPYKFTSNDKEIQWQPLARWLFENYSNPVIILDIFKRTFFPTSWSGSYAEKVSKYLPLISSLKNHSDISISKWSVTEEIVFEEYIRNCREEELSREQERNERFE